MNNQLNEKINRQRKLMGLDENKFQIGLKIVPDESANAEFKGIHRDDINEFEVDDEPGETPRYGKHKYTTHPDEKEFYSNSGENFADKMDREYPDPNEREWRMNRYNNDIQEGPKDFVRSVASGIKDFPNKMKYDKAKRAWDKQSQQIKQNIDNIKDTMGNTVQLMSSANQQFNVVKGLGANMLSFNPVAKMNQDLNNTVNTLNDAITKAEAALNGDMVANQQANQQANTANNNQTVNGFQNQINQNANNPQTLNTLLQNLANMAQGNTGNPDLEKKLQNLEATVQKMLANKNGGNTNAPQTNAPQTNAEANAAINQMAADRGMTPSAQKPATPKPAYTATTTNQTGDQDDDYYTQHQIDPNDKITTSMSEKKKIKK
jgi:hypothetical protein